MILNIKKEEVSKNTEVVKCVEKFSKNMTEKIYKDYLRQLVEDYNRIESEVLPHLDKFKTSTNEVLTLLASKKCSSLMKTKLVKKLISLYFDEKVYVARCNTVKVLSGGFTFETLGSDKFKDRVFGKKGNYNLCGDMVYTDLIDFDKTWKDSKSKTMQQAYDLRRDMFKKLNSYNAYFDKIKICIQSLDKIDLDKKLDKHLSKLRNADYKAFVKKYGKVQGMGMSSDFYGSNGLLGLGIGIW